MFSYGKSQKFACRGILLSVEYFGRKGHQITVIVPFKYQILARKGEVENSEIVHELHHANILSFAPPNSSDDE